LLVGFVLHKTLKEEEMATKLGKKVAKKTKAVKKKVKKTAKAVKKKVAKKVKAVKKKIS